MLLGREAVETLAADICDHALLEFSDTPNQIAVCVSKRNGHALHDLLHRPIGQRHRVRPKAGPIGVHIPIGRGTETLKLLDRVDGAASDRAGLHPAFAIGLICADLLLQ